MRLFSALTALALLAGTAHAADLKVPYKAPPLPPVSWNWTSISVGAYGDYGANFAQSTTTMPGGITFDLSTIPHGPGLGGELEALYQASGSEWVIGVRGDIGWANLQSTATATAGTVTVLSLSNATNYLGNVDVELGYTLDPRLLGYVVGGFAFGGAHPNLTALGTSQAITDTSVGWNFGAGLRYALTKTLSVYIEGDYYDLGSKTLSIIPPGGTIAVATNSSKLNITEQKAGFKLNILPSN